jgi:hypothetical protein
MSPSKEDFIKFLNTEEKYLNITFLNICYDEIKSAKLFGCSEYSIFLIFQLLYTNQVSSAQEAIKMIKKGEIV